MKVCVTALGPKEDSEVDPRFGRCRFFVFFNLHTREVEGVANPNIESSGGAGIQSAQLVASKGAAIVLTGHVGPNAFKTLSAAGVSIFTGATSTVKEAVAAYEAGKLTRAIAPDSASKSGMGR
ncbi:MAG: dinitrogenase iron-molybdenum cofactor biosynthesis protein [Candidatus Omnitrophica bacterium]|nr:dinitrogenase iron-molybdenum cofactor biosynthesis protein [Candidatus Omnitrophota bacterium]